MSNRVRMAIVATSSLLMAAVASAQTPLTLRDAVSMALRHDTRVEEADIRLESATRQVQVNHAHFGPNLFTGTGAVYSYGLPQTPTGTLPSVLNVGFTQTVFDRVARGRGRAA